MIKVGEKTVVYNSIVFVPENEEAEVSVALSETDTLVIAFKFEVDEITDKKEKLKPTFTMEGEDNRGVMTFKNWTSTFGSSITNPFVVASADNGEVVSFLGNIVKIGEMYKIEFQLMTGRE